MDSTQLPPFFPLVRQGCEEKAAAFFQCLTEKLPPGEKVNSKEAATCNPLREAYEKCFKEVSAKLPPPSVRVSYEAPEDE